MIASFHPQSVHNQRRTMQKAPKDECPRRAMPKAAD